MLHTDGRTEFDHAVVMVRDRLEQMAPHFESQGFTLSDVARHNLGSWNRLIVLEGSYVELLGWPPGAPPARKEIADSALGLEALVLRTEDADATYERLRAAGFAVNPVQVLTRDALVDGQRVEAQFHTVRFSEQPIAGLRMYFCRHLTPACVWQPALMAHANGARRLVGIEVQSPDPSATAQRLGLVAGVPVVRAADGFDVQLGNLSLHVCRADRVAAALASLTVEYQGGQPQRLDIGL